MVLGAGVTGFLALLLGRKKKKVTVFFEDDFENFNVKGWNVETGVGTGIVERSAVQKASGTYSLHMSSVDDNLSTAYLRALNLFNVQPPWHLSFKIFIVAASVVSFWGHPWMLIRPSGTGHVLNNYQQKSAPYEQTVKELANNTWYKIDVFCDGSGLKYYVDEVFCGSFDSYYSPSGAVTEFNIDMDNIEDACYGNIYVDDFILDNVTGYAKMSETSETTAVVSDFSTRVRTVRHLSSLSPLITG